MTNISRKERLQRRRKRAEKIIFLIGITAVIFVVATYAWFIGTTQITVSNFTLNVKSGDGLELSLDGKTFDTSVTISKEIIDALKTEGTGTYLAENGNKNYWTEEGLEPISTVGEMDTTNSVLKLFNKTSIATLTGGYKLRSNLIENGTAETGGYVAFDLFIRNKSGEGYIEEFNHANDEGVYLIGDSEVKMVANGEDPTATGGDGVQNSIRLAFMQIARIDMTETDKSKVQNMSCTTSTGVTPLCAVTAPTGFDSTGRGLTWNIWEPNNDQHIESAKTHYEAICKKRTDENVYAADACEWVTEDQKTYAVRDTVDADDLVNVYDGHNGYAGSTYSETNIEGKLVEMDYFTDTEKNETDKKEIFYISPNSITKLRVYIYLEGQDVDNYDLGSYGKLIQINFGFTKDKFGISGTEPESEPGSGS